MCILLGAVREALGGQTSLHLRHEDTAAFSTVHQQNLTLETAKKIKIQHTYVVHVL